MWKLIKMSCSGKILVIKTDLLPTLLDVAYFFPMPALVCLKLQKAVFHFIWGVYEYILKEQQPVERGARGVPNLRLKCNTF